MGCKRGQGEGRCCQQTLCNKAAAAAAAKGGSHCRQGYRIIQNEALCGMHGQGCHVKQHRASPRQPWTGQPRPRWRASVNLQALCCFGTRLEQRVEHSTTDSVAAIRGLSALTAVHRGARIAFFNKPARMGGHMGATVGWAQGLAGDSVLRRQMTLHPEVPKARARRDCSAASVDRADVQPGGAQGARRRPGARRLTCSKAGCHRWRSSQSAPPCSTCRWGSERWWQRRRRRSLPR